MRYDPSQEHRIDLATPEAQARIADARALFHSFVATHRDVSLADEGSVDRAYTAAEGVLTAAQAMRELVFSRDTTTYGVSYISDSCASNCVYCPIRKDSVGEDGRPIKRKTLSIDEFVADTQEIIADGHSHICFLAGDGTLTTAHPERIIPYLRALDAMEGIDEIILNVTPQRTETFREWRAATTKPLQFRVFQETYDERIYAEKHPAGPKADYRFRRGAQARAMDAGFDNYGLGVLLGLNPLLVQEVEALVAHADELTAAYGKAPARVCLPTANTLAGVRNIQPQHHVSAKANELAYALAKLGMPTVSIVSSERDTPEMLHVLDRYASNRTVDVQPSVGGNLAQRERGGRVLKQTTVFPTGPEATRQEYAERGYTLVFRH